MAVAGDGDEGQAVGRGRPRRGWVVAAVVLLVVGSLVGYVVWQRNTGVHAGDTYRVVLTRHGCQQADPLFLEGWAWKGVLPTQYGDGPVPGTLRVNSVEKRMATFTADAGWTSTFSGYPSGFADLGCSVAG